MNNTGKILTALGTGAVAGAIVGVLFAPDKGSGTRRKMNGQGKKIAGVVQGKFCKGNEKFNNLKEGIVQTVKEKVEEFT